MAQSMQPPCNLSDFSSAFEEKYIDIGRRSSRGQEDIRVWDTNCPDSIPTPPLFPGECIQLKQHRILCTDGREVPLIGSLFLTNCRVIFTGSPVNDSSKSKEVLQFIDGQSKSSFPAAATKTLGRESGKLVRKARNFSHKLTDDSRSSPRPAPSDSFSSHGDDADGTDSSGRERALSTARNFIRNIRRTLRRRSSNTDNEPGMNDMEDQDDVSSESGSIHSLSPLSRMKTDGVDFEKIPDEFVSMEHDDSADSEEDFDHPVVSDKTPDNVDDDKGEDAGEESDSKPSLIRKEISRHLTSSVSIRPRISANINPHYMNFSFMTSPKPRSLTAVDPSKPPIPVPRNSKTPPTLVRNIRPTSPEEDPGVLKSYDKDTDSEEEGGGLMGKFPGSTSAANTLTSTNPVQPSSTPPPTRTRHQSSTPPPTSAQHPSSTPPPTSTQHPSSTPPPSSTQHPSSAPPPTGSQQLSSSLTSVSTFEEKRTERIALNGSVSVPTENRSENQSIDCCQNGVSSSTGESPLLKLKGRSPVPPTTPPFTRSETTQSISTSSDPESGRVFGRQSAIGPPPTPPKKPSSFKFQDVSSSRESSPRPGRNTQPFPGRNAQISSEARGGYNSPKLSKDPPVEQSRNLLVRSSRSRQTTTGAAGSGSHVQGSQVDQLELGESSSNTTTDARIRELISYENFLPLAWRSKPATKSATISEEAGSEVGIERSTLTRSLRLRTQIRAMKEDDSERDYRKSMTLPHPGDMRPFTSVVPVSYSTVLWCFNRSVYQVKPLQSSATIVDWDITPGQGLHVMCWNFNSLKLYIHPNNTYDAEKLRKIIDEDILKPRPVEKQYAVKYRQGVMFELGARYLSYVHEKGKLRNNFSMTDEAKRLGFLSLPLWTVSNFSEKQLSVCPTYPAEVIVPRPTPLVDIARAAPFFRESRFPVATWRNTENGAILFRGSAPAGRRGSSASKDEQSLLQQICGCLEARGDVKLYSFTEKKLDINLKYVGNTQQQEAYYYSGVKFVDVDRLPTHKTLRSSFNKVFHLLEQNEGHSGYLSALENTGWIHKISDLLGLSSEVCALMSDEASSVLVAYESGWDITTQVVSLSQLMMDPYYRTMEGFQILVQKEWLAFGHPFATRHGCHSYSSDSSPVFLQWVDCVWQISQQCPSAFEFNPLFLETLVDHSYSGMFGTFLADSHCERQKMEETVSFWTFVEICNRKDQRFLNTIYDKNLYPGVLYVQFEVHCMKLWSSYYSRLKAGSIPPTYEGLGAEVESMMTHYQELRSKVLSLEAELLRTNSQDEVQSASSKNSKGFVESNQYDLGPVVLPGSVSKKVPQDVLAKHRSSKAIVIKNLSEYLKSRGIEPEISYHVELHGTTCSGYLVKLGGLVRSWKNRWFVLDINKGFLCYFQNKEAYCNKVNPKGVINLQDVQDVYQTAKEDHLKNHIFLVVTPQRTYYIRTPSLPTLRVWMTLLEIPLQNKQNS